MQRRTLLPRLGGGLAVATSVGLAGCSGGESADGTPSGAATDTGTASDSSMGETPDKSPSDGLPGASGVSGDVVESSVEGLAIVDHSAGMPDGQSPPEGQTFSVGLTVENRGGSETAPTQYNFELGLFDGDGTDITPSVTAIQPGDIEIAPTERATLALSGIFGSDGEYAPEDVARYEISLSCEQDSDETYCDG